MKRKLHGVTLFLAVSVSVISACVSVLLMAGDYHSAQFNLDTHDREYQGWQACLQTNPAYYKENKKAVDSCLTNLEDARGNFWLKCSKVELAGMFIAVGLGSAVGGYLTIWVLVWLIGMVFNRFARWLSLRSPPKTRGPLDRQSPFHADISAEY
jgi:hypothetical protein